MKVNFKPQDLRANQRFLAQELLSRGVKVQMFDWQNEILEACINTHVEILADIDSSIVPYASSIVAGSKSLTKKLLKRAGISVPEGIHFSSEQAEEAIEYVEEYLKFPLVLKPSNGIQGEHVNTGLESKEELLSAIQSIVNDLGHVELIAERHFSAHEFRVFITRTGAVAALYREPAYVVGDGVSDIETLAKKESFRRLNPRINCLCEIALDAEATHYLKKRALNFKSIPQSGQKVYLRGSSNVKKGGVPTDVTDLMHPSVAEICLKALKAIPGLPYGGIDFMCRDIRQKQEGDSYRILEINSVPGIGIHMAPGRGKPRNVAAMIVDMIFPESMSNRRSSKWAA